MSDYPAFGKIPRLNREIVITEKIDGTNGLISITRALDADGNTMDGNPLWIGAGSRNRWLSDKEDNHGFHKWVMDNADTLIEDLGEGLHYGEWWGKGIGKRYSDVVDDKFFSLFNVGRWPQYAPLMTFTTPNLRVVPVLARINAKDMNYVVRDKIGDLKAFGSMAAKGCMNPEGLIIFHTASRHLYKVTLEGDEKPKGKS